MQKHAWGQPAKKFTGHLPVVRYRGEANLRKYTNVGTGVRDMGDLRAMSRDQADWLTDEKMAHAWEWAVGRLGRQRAEFSDSVWDARQRSKSVRLKLRRAFDDARAAVQKPAQQEAVGLA